jgi:hypothetical protein
VYGYYVSQALADRETEYENAEAMQQQPQEARGWRRTLMTDGVSYSLQQRINAKKRGLGRQKYPFVCQYYPNATYHRWTFTPILHSLVIHGRHDLRVDL